MNLLLLDSDDFVQDNQAQLRGRRLQHLLGVHKVTTGQQLRVGLLNGRMGSGIVTAVSDQQVTLSDLTLNQMPPSALPLTLLLALPRPKMLRRVFQTASAMGVKKIVLLNSARVEKSFWQSPFLQAPAIREQLILGLEQARDTVLPEVILEKRFKPFVEDQLPHWLNNSRALVAHPYNASPCPSHLDAHQHCLLAIGPEGGFVPYEVEKLQSLGFEAVSLGERILRVETAIPVLLAKLYNF